LRAIQIFPSEGAFSDLRHEWWSVLEMARAEVTKQTSRERCNYEIKKLEILIPHWVEHNREHGNEFLLQSLLARKLLVDPVYEAKTYFMRRLG
jgi:hypothetical protein